MILFVCGCVLPCASEARASLDVTRNILASSSASSLGRVKHAVLKVDIDQLMQKLCETLSVEPGTVSGKECREFTDEFHSGAQLSTDEDCTQK